MVDIDKVIRGWERCQKCRTFPLMGNIEYVQCEYTVGLHCGKDRLIYETLCLLRDQKKQIVRCEDCKWNVGTMEKPYCQIMGNTRKPDWYCADGKKWTEA